MDQASLWRGGGGWVGIGSVQWVSTFAEMAWINMGWQVNVGHVKYYNEKQITRENY